jgi:hypothetical protein
MTHPIRISASRLKQLKECTMAFYLKEVVRLPDSSHWKARLGTLAHLVFECVLHPRRAALLERILRAEAFQIEDYPALVRLVEWQFRREDITLSSVAEVGELLQVAFHWVKPYFINAEGVFTPPPRYYREHEFKLVVGDAVVKGYIDLLMVWEDRALVGDLKSQREKWTRADVPNNVQAAIYALATYREFGLIPAVEFIMLRHPPSKRCPRNHIQRVEAPSPMALVGLEDYIESMYRVVNQFSYEDACSHPHDDEGFCTRVCQFHKPFTYHAVLKDGEVVRTYLETQTPEVKKGETLEQRRHEGCLLRWRG